MPPGKLVDVKSSERWDRDVQLMRAFRAAYVELVNCSRPGHFNGSFLTGIGYWDGHPQQQIARSAAPDIGLDTVASRVSRLRS